MTDTCQGKVLVPLSSDPNSHQEFITVKSTWFPFNRITPLICSWHVKVRQVVSGLRFARLFGLNSAVGLGEQQLPSRSGHHDSWRTQPTGGWWGLFERLLSGGSLHERIKVRVFLFVFFCLFFLSGFTLNDSIILDFFHFLKRICGRVHTVPAFQWYVDNQQPEDVTIILKHVGLNDGYSEGLAFTLSGQSGSIIWFSRSDDDISLYKNK